MSVSPSSAPDLFQEKVAELRKGEPRTAVEMWKRRVAQTPTRAAFRFYDDGNWKPMTFAEADSAAREIAAGLVASGLVPGDRVCLLAQTRVEWALCDVAVLLAGGVTVPIYASNTAEQCEFIIRDAGAKLVIVEDAEQRDKVLPLRDRLFTVTAMVQMGGQKGEGAGAGSDYVRPLSALRAAGRQWLETHPEGLDAHA
jgi:long-chain acyl-CoA synthetase